MTLSPTEQAAKDFLNDVNGDPYDPLLNPRGMGDPGYLINFEIYTSAIATYGNAIERESGDVVAAVTNASSSAATAISARDAAIVARNAAEFAATQVSFPFGVTAGTSTAYTLDFTPDQPTASGSAFRVQFHTICGNNPTLSIDGATAADLINQAGQNLQAGDIATNRIYIIIYDAALSKWAVNNFVANEVLRSDETATLSSGYNSDIHAIGTISSGTVALASNSTDENKKTLTNNGPFTLTAPSTNTNIELIVTNGASAGAITLSGFTHRSGSFDTTNGRVFVCYITTSGSFKEIVIRQAEAV